MVRIRLVVAYSQPLFLTLMYALYINIVVSICHFFPALFSSDDVVVLISPKLHHVVHMRKQKR